MNIVTGNGVFIHCYVKSVLLSWTKLCLLLRWVVCVYSIVKQIFFSSLQCALSLFVFFLPSPAIPCASSASRNGS